MTIFQPARRLAQLSKLCEWYKLPRMPEPDGVITAYTDQGNRLFVPFFQGLLAEIEAQDDAEGALTRIDEALALAPETGERWSDAFLHRLRGEMQLKRDPGEWCDRVTLWLIIALKRADALPPLPAVA